MLKLRYSDWIKNLYISTGMHTLLSCQNYNLDFVAPQSRHQAQSTLHQIKPYPRGV